MGEYTDYEIDRMLDAGYSPFSGREPKGRRDKVPPNNFYKGKTQKKGAKKGKKVPLVVQYPSKSTDPALPPEYPEKLFDMSFFPKPVVKVPEPTVWNVSEDDAPF